MTRGKGESARAEHQGKSRGPGIGRRDSTTKESFVDEEKGEKEQAAVKKKRSDVHFAKAPIRKRRRTFILEWGKGEDIGR